MCVEVHNYAVVCECVRMSLSALAKQSVSVLAAMS